MEILGLDFAAVDSVLGTLVVVGGVAGGLWQYREAQLWKRSEFAAARMDEFFSDARVKVVLTTLDYSARRIRLMPDADADPVRVDDALLCRALRPHDGPAEEKPARFTQEEVVLRDAFDHFLDNLERFEHYLATGLVRRKDLLPYLRYWLEAMTVRAHERPQFNETLWGYVDRYRYGGVKRLLQRCGYAVPVTSAASPATPRRAS